MNTAATEAAIDAPYCYVCGEDPCDCPDEDVMDIETLGELIRGQFPAMIEEATGGELSQRQDEELVVWNGYGFRIALSDGTYLDVELNRRFTA